MTHLLHSNKIYHRYQLNRLFEQKIPIFSFYLSFQQRLRQRLSFEILIDLLSSFKDSVPLKEMNIEFAYFCLLILFFMNIIVVEKANPYIFEL